LHDKRKLLGAALIGFSFLLLALSLTLLSYGHGGGRDCPHAPPIIRSIASTKRMWRGLSILQSPPRRGRFLDCCKIEIPQRTTGDICGDLTAPTTIFPPAP